MQQAVTNSSRKWVLSANNGTIIQALQYHAANVPNPVKVAIHDGFTAQLATPSLVEGRCPSSNCTWAPYTSLGICSSTVDASSQLTKNCTTDQDCTWTIKNDSGLQSPMRFTTKSADDSTNLWISTNVSANGYMGLPDDKFVVSNVSGSFADVYIIYASDIAAASWKSSSRNLAACGNCGLSAIRTTMSVCLQKLQTDMTNGSTSTKKLAADGDITWEGVTARDSNDNNRFLASLWTMADGESLNFTVSYGGLYLLASYIRGQYDGNATLNGNLTSAGVLGGDPSDTTRFLAQDLWGPQLTRYNAKQSLAGIDMRFSNISQTMSNAYVFNLPLGVAV